MEAQVHQAVQQQHGLVVPHFGVLVALVHQVGKVLFIDGLVVLGAGRFFGQHVEEDQAAYGNVVLPLRGLLPGLLFLVVVHRGLGGGFVDHAHFYLGVQVHQPVLVGGKGLFLVVEELAFTHFAVFNLGKVVHAQHHVVRRGGHRAAAGGAEDVVGGHHQHARFHLRFLADGHVHGHLVAVEVGVERRAGQGMQLDGQTFYKDGLERLDAEAVQRGRAVEHHGMLLGNALQDVPDLVVGVLHLLLGHFQGDVLFLYQFGQHEGLEQLERHFLREPALVQLQVRAYHDDGTAGIVHALAQQVLAEAALLAFEDVGNGLQRAVGRAEHHFAARAVLYEGVHGFLQQAFFVVDHHLRRAQGFDVLKAVVAVDDPSVKVVEVRRGEPAAFQRHQGAQVGRQHGQHGHDHPLGVVAAGQEAVHDLHALDGFGAVGVVLYDGDLFLYAGHLHFNVDILEQFADGVGANAHFDLGVFLLHFAELGFREHLAALVLDAAGHGVLGVFQHHVSGVVHHFLEVGGAHVQQDAYAAGAFPEEPDVGHGAGQLYVAHALAAHFRLGNFHAAAVAHHAFELHPAVFAAGALVVLGGPEDALAQQAVALGLERAVIDGLRLLHFAERPVAYFLGAGYADLYGVEIEIIEFFGFFPGFPRVE